jgi:predicted site-specific integrase-resolvase
MANANLVNASHVRIRDAAAMLGVSQSTLRRYEMANLIPKAARNRSGQRVFTQQDLEIIRGVIVPPLKGADNDH